MYMLNQYLRDTFGQKVYKLSIDGGFTCPNRDGTLGYGGCIFCSARGSGDFAENRGLSITEQIEKGKARVSDKIKTGRYIAYFQAFTNTYGSIEHMREVYYEAINHPDIVALSIGTRPDCLGKEVIKLLCELNRIKPVWVELGLQTINEKTAEYIRRGYGLKVYDEAMMSLKAAGITTIVHVILGLPGESEADMAATVRYVVDSGANGIKLQLLHVIAGTDLEKEYLAGKFRTLEFEEYLELVANLVKLIPDNVVIHRLTGDGDKRTLVAPMWSADKKRVLNAMKKKLQIE